MELTGSQSAAVKSRGDGVLDAHEITHAFHARFFAFHEGSTCGQGNPEKVGGKETLVPPEAELFL